MKEKRKVRGELRIYLQWPLLLSVLVVAMNLIVGILNAVAGPGDVCIYPGLCGDRSVAVFLQKETALWGDLWNSPPTIHGFKSTCCRR